MINLLFTLIAIALIFGVAWWIITMIPLPPPFPLVFRVVFGLVLLLVLVGLLWPYTGADFGPPLYHR
jgi:hypothetical protein